MKLVSKIFILFLLIAFTLFVGFIVADTLGVVTSCWICVPARNMLGVIKTMVDRVYGDGAGIISGLHSLLTIMFALWVVYFTMKYVTSLAAKSPAQYWSDLLKKSIVVMFVSFLMASSSSILTIFNYFLFPFIKMFIDVGLSILSGLGEDARASTCTYTPTSSSSYATPGAFFVALADPITCIMEKMTAEVSHGMFIAKKIMTSGVNVWVTVVGIIAYIFFFFIIIIFPLQIFDSLFKLAVAMILAPLAIMLYAFNSTRVYTHKVFQMVFFVAVHLSVVSLVLSLCVTVVMRFMIDLDPNLMTVNGVENFSAPALNRISNLEYRELALLAVLIYLYHILHTYMEMINVVSGSWSNDATTMAVTVKDQVMALSVVATSKTIAMIPAAAGATASVVKGGGRLASKAMNKMKG